MMPLSVVSQQQIQARALHPTGVWEEFPKEEIDLSIPARFEKIVARYPDRLAVKSFGYEFTYAQLNALANQVANTLLEQYGAGSDRVALLLDNDAPLLAVIHGVLKTGKAYVILDPNFPEERLRYYFEDAGVVALVTEAAHLDLARRIAQVGGQLIEIDQLPADISDQNPLVDVAPDAVALVLYTSGSTGRPKGVFNNHRNLLKYVSIFTNRFHIVPEDRFTCVKSFSVNSAVKDLFVPTLNGASVFPFHPNQHGYRALAYWIQEHRLTIYNSSVTAFRQMIQYLDDPETISSIRAIGIGAEPVALRDLESYRRFCSNHCVLSTAYGATETTSYGARLLMDKETSLATANLPAGYPDDSIDILILNDDYQPVKMGELGEIAVKSPYLALGYWNRPDLTRERFLADPTDPTQRIYLSGDLGYLQSDGCLIHLGRKDLQAKIHGIRIDIVEIEYRLMAHPQIADAAVDVKQDRVGAEKLVAYLVAAGDFRPTVTDLRAFLAQHLAAQMIPTAYVWLAQLPMTSQAKLDRLNLPLPGMSRPSLAANYRAPQLPIEQQLAAIWSQVLDLEEVGIDDPFLDLGGDSLKSMQILAQVMDAFQVEITPSDLFTAQTVAEMAQLILQQQLQAMESAEIEQLLAELEREQLEQND